METESKIVTLFEFTQRGYEETQQQLEKLIDTQKKVGVWAKHFAEGFRGQR